VFGLLNMIGTAGTLAPPGFVGWYADRRRAVGDSVPEPRDPVFDVYVVVPSVGAGAWARYRRRPVAAP